MPVDVSRWYEDESEELASLCEENGFSSEDFCCCLSENHVGLEGGGKDQVLTQVNDWLESQNATFRAVDVETYDVDFYQWKLAPVE